MGYRFLIVTTDYNVFLHWLYAQHPGLEKKTYEEQRRVREESLFGVVNFYVDNLRNLSHEAYGIYANSEFIQKGWAKDHGICVKHIKSFFQRGLRFLNSYWPWFYSILGEQIKFYKPDILLNQSMSVISSDFLKEFKPYVRLVIGQHAATGLPDNKDWRCYDLVISSFPPTVEWFRQRGIPAELNRMGFEPKILGSLIPNGDASLEVTFIGSFHRIHRSRIELLESLCERFENIKVWGPGINHLSLLSPIRRCYAGQAWGQEMYQILRNSKITLNHHGDIPPYANNMRLFEATGAGALLITDWKKNLHDMFELGKEIVTYKNPEECVELIQYYLRHNDERKTISLAGQRRTLREHTYLHRMEELIAIIQKFL